LREGFEGELSPVFGASRANTNTRIEHHHCDGTGILVYLFDRVMHVAKRPIEGHWSAALNQLRRLPEA
jgi:hypothetical protein